MKPTAASRFSVDMVPDTGTALKLAAARRVRPTALDTEGIRDVFGKDVMARSVFSARNTHAGVLASISRQIEKVLQGRDVSTARRVLKGLITRAGYTPEGGFPGDEGLGIPPARPGSITDLGSNARINLILETQVALLQGRAQRVEGLEPAALDLYPGYELMRVEGRRAPRDWRKRWRAAGGKLTKDKRGRMRMVALKTDSVWERLGDFALFPDALGVDHPPFAFNSGMGWQELDKKECIALKLIKKEKQTRQVVQATPKLLPPATASTKALPPRIRTALGRGLKDIEASAGRVSMKPSQVTQAFKPPPPPKSSARRTAQMGRDAYAEFNALFTLLAV